MDEAVRPDYDGAWVGALVPALLGGERPEWLPEAVADARAVVLLVLDGFGWSALQEHRRRLPVLAGMAARRITTVVPSTTSAGLTSISTGLSPAEHGVVGYRMRVGGQVLNVLRWPKDGDRPQPDPVSVQPAPPFLSRRVPVVTRAEFAGSGFTKAHLRDTALTGWRTPATMVEHCRRLLGQGQRFVYAYYDGVDKVAHEYGLRDGFLTAELAATDRLVGDLLAVLTGDDALLVTADHGLVHVDQAGQVGLEPLDAMVGAYSGEGRFRSLHARAGAAAELLAAAGERYGRQAWVFSRERLFDEGWLGPRAGAEVRGRLGDVVLAAKAGAAFVDPTHRQETKLIGWHGSLTPEEVHVPLLAARGGH